MKNPNELRKYVIFQLNECEAIREYLEEMALKGWALKYITTFFCFAKIEPQKLIYSVEVFSKASVFDTVPANSTKEYIDYCKEAGWSFVCNKGQINIFVSNSQNAIPIETDERLKFETIKRGMLKENASTWFFLLPLFMFNITLYIMDYESLITSNMRLFTFLSYIIFFAEVIIQIINFTVWNIKQTKNLKIGKPIQYISKSGRSKRRIVQLIPLFIMVLFLLVVAFFSFLQGDYLTALITGFIILIAPLLILVFHFLQKSRLKTSDRTLPNVFCYGISVIIIFISGFIILLSDTDSSLDDKAIYSSKSFLASTATFEYVTESKEEILVTIFKSNYKPIIKHYLHSETHHNFMDEFNIVSSPEWDAKTAYISDGNYSIEFDTYFISFYCDKSLTKGDIAKIKSFVY